jgi:hypothetical protein
VDIKLTKEEQNAITSLKRLAKKWPKTLWLYSASGTLNVMKCGENGEQVMTQENHRGGFDSDYCIDKIEIPNDGGDW